jgi:hypothetical protein
MPVCDYNAFFFKFSSVRCKLGIFGNGISRGTRPRSPFLNPCDFCVKGMLKVYVCSNNTHNDEDLEINNQNIVFF